MLVALGGLMTRTVLFMLAESAVWLFVARGIQGLSTGAALSAASASLWTCIPGAIRRGSASPTPRRRQPVSTSAPFSHRRLW